MVKNILLAVGGAILGILISLIIIFYTPIIPPKFKTVSPLALITPPKEVIGFLPYWLLDKAKSDYSPDLTTLTYFGLTVDTDGSIKRRTNPQEGEPGWVALTSGKLKPLLDTARDKGMKRSLLIFSADPDEITTLIDKPTDHAQKLVSDVVPVMEEYGFSDLNIDIENVKDASEEAQLNMTKFIKTVHDSLKKKLLGVTLTVEISPTDLIKQRVLDPKSIAPFSDYIVIMAYDYHYSGSLVTGPVAPLFGVEQGAEFDTQTAVQKALVSIPEQKIILGVPLYGYEWETLDDFPRAGVIPGTGLTASNARAEDILETCASCSAKWDDAARESYVVYEDQDTGTYHQIFIPDAKALNDKISYVQKNHLAGLALWALGYEGKNILTPLHSYK